MIEGRSAPDLRSVIQPKPTALVLAGLELVQPRVVPRGVRLRIGPVVTAVAQPQLGVLRDVLDLALHDPGVAAARHPGAQPLLPVLPLDVLPVGEEMREPAVLQPVPRLLHERAAQVVPGHPAVPVREPGAGRDHERRVGDDQVVRPVPDRLEERALPQLGGGRAGQGQGQPGEAQRPRVADRWR